MTQTLRHLIAMGLTIITMFGVIEFNPIMYSNAEPGRPTGWDLAKYYLLGLFLSIAFNVVALCPIATSLEKIVKKRKPLWAKIITGLLPIELFISCGIVICAIFQFDSNTHLFILVPVISIFALFLIPLNFYWSIFWLTTLFVKKVNCSAQADAR